jgi:hypothetical protein
MSFSFPQSSLVVFGGNSFNILQNDLWCFSLLTSFWSRVNPVTHTVPGKFYSDPRQMHGAFASAFSPLFYVFGGITELGAQNDLWVFDFASQRWAKIRTKNPPLPRSDFGYVNYDDGKDEFFAVYGGQTPFADDNRIYV